MSSQPPAVSGKKITIVGAGIAGLSLALSLRKQWPDSSPPPTLTIYERESKETIIGREGYSLSIRGDALSGGIQVLQQLEVLERMLPFSLSGTAPRTGTFNLWSTDWANLLRFPVVSSSSDQPMGMRIARAVLRRVMIEAVLETDNITWSKPCTQIETLSDGKPRLHFPDGTADDCDILIVADGASSKIRGQLRPDDSLDFTGIVCMSGTAAFPDSSRAPYPVDADWGGVLGGRGTGLFVSPVDTSRSLWSLSYRSEHPRERLGYPLSEEQVEKILDEALERGKYFTEPFQSLVRATDPTTLMVFNAMEKRPFPHTSTSAPGSGSGSGNENENGRVIFVGDTNHAVSPFAGNGANMALLDGWDLAEQFVRDVDLGTALEAYDSKSLPRSTATLKQSHWAIDLLHATGVKLFVYRVVLKIASVFMWWRG